MHLPTNMELPSLRLDRVRWACFAQTEQVLLLTAQGPSPPLETLLQTANWLEHALGGSLMECIPAVNSLALVFDPAQTDHQALVQQLAEMPEAPLASRSYREWKIPVCYDVGPDWEEVLSTSGLSRAEAMERHTQARYRMALMGFVPGFLYLDGLPEVLSCPRKAQPRLRVPMGAVGIGGNQTGIYSLPSPGGWQLIGQVPENFLARLHAEAGPQPGDYVQFYSIPRSQFKTWKEPKV
ncbi:MAG: allophanate hydrolase subunit 1 [Salibacteraceae bacterium]